MQKCLHNNYTCNVVCNAPLDLLAHIIAILNLSISVSLVSFPSSDDLFSLFFILSLFSPLLHPGPQHVSRAKLVILAAVAVCELLSLMLVQAALLPDLFVDLV